MIKTLFIQNYRSIQNLNVTFGPLNAFIGPNNAGKSNILNALNIILGESWPTIKSFDKKDFYNYDDNSEIKIGVIFNNHINIIISNNRYNISGIMLIVTKDNFEFVAINSDKNPTTYRGSNYPIKVSSEIRDKIALLYLGIERQAGEPPISGLF